MVNRMILNQTSYFGAGSISSIVDEVKNRGFKKGVAPTKKPCVSIIAIPTTAGTAAEVTINYVITDEEKKRKFVCVDSHDIPALAKLAFADVCTGGNPRDTSEAEILEIYKTAF